MNLHFRTIILVFISTTACLGQARHVTLTLHTRHVNTVGVTTNEFQVAEYETAELVSLSLYDGAVNLTTLKGGLEIPSAQNPKLGSSGNGWEFKNFVVTGPATIRAMAPYNNYHDYFVTFRITPEAFPPDRTIIAMPGTNRTSVVMECSTNLVHWISATNGIYGPLPEAKFFRIQARVVD